MTEEAVPPAAWDRIRSAVLQIHSRKLEGAGWDSCVREAYDAYARELLRSGRLESDEVLDTHILGWVFRDAVEFGWMPYPPLRRERREKVHEDAWIPGAMTTWWEDVPVPDADLTESLGGYRVNDRYKRLMEKELAGRIAFWKGELLRRTTDSGQPPEPSSRIEEVPSLVAAKSRSTSNPRDRRTQPNRAVWLQQRLTERAWNPNDVARHRGPDRKTVRKILDGREVREDVLEKLANALSRKHGKVTLTDIPRDLDS